jgi:hypothetical protein
MFQVFQWFQNVYFKCLSGCYRNIFGCRITCVFQTYISSVLGVSYIYILQMFHLDVAKVDLNVVYVAMAIHVCFKRIFQVFHLFLGICCKFSIECFKSRFGGAHVAMASMTGG